MYIEEFVLDVNHSAINRIDTRLDEDGNEVIRYTFSNGFIWIYTETMEGLSRIDFSHHLIKQPNGSYIPDLNNRKLDFIDYL